MNQVLFRAFGEGADLFVGAEATPVVSPLARKISGFLIGKTVGSICRALRVIQLD